jgi:hypothetical protein
MLKTVLLAGVMALALTVAPPITTEVLAQAQQTGAKPTAAPTAKPAAKRAPSAGQQAMRDRQRKCGAEWKEAKAGGKVDKSMTWPKYWSSCNKRLKGA